MSLQHHLEPYCNGIIFDNWDATGIKYWRCFSCGAFEHEPLAFKGADYSGHIGNLSRFPDLAHTPYGQESDWLDFKRFYGTDFTYRRPTQEPRPVLRNPVPISFNPIECFQKNDGKEHEGIRFREVWADPIARTLWLGHKPFMLTNQYFRSYCVGHAENLRKHPERLLGERVSFHFDKGFGVGDYYGHMAAIGSQLVPYLMHWLDQEGIWPFMRLPGLRGLAWRVTERKAA